MTSRQCGRAARRSLPPPAVPGTRAAGPPADLGRSTGARGGACTCNLGFRRGGGRTMNDRYTVTSTPHRRHARTFPSDRTPNGIVPIPLAPAHAVTRTALRAGPPARVVGARGVRAGRITTVDQTRASRALSRVEGARVSNHISQALRRRGLDPSGPMEDTRRRHGSTQPHAPPRPRPRRKRHNHTRELTRTPGSHQSRRT